MCRCPRTNVPLILLGREHDNGRGKRQPNAWSDFGGKRETTDVSPVDTALRELAEETYGVFDGRNIDVDDVLASGYVEAGRYALVALRVGYVELPRFADVMRDVEKRRGEISKDDFVWLPIDDVRRAMQANELRVYTPPASPCITATGRHSSIAFQRFFQIANRSTRILDQRNWQF
jgi:NUDIX domain